CYTASAWADLVPDLRMRGSRAGYSKSTTKLAVTKTIAVSTTIPCSSGISCWVTASIITCPRPARENTVSVITEPANTAPTVVPATVIAGAAAFLSACRKKIHDSDAPLARNTSIYGCSYTLSKAFSNTCATGAARCSDRTTTGIASEKNVASGNSDIQPSLIENSCSARSPN